MVGLDSMIDNIQQPVYSGICVTFKRTVAKHSENISTASQVSYDFIQLT